MSLQTNARIFGIIILCSFSLLSGMLIGEKTALENIPKETTKEIVYLEIPVIIPEEDVLTTEIASKEELYLDYFSKLTETNREEWFHGYNIMIENWEDQPLHITDVYSDEELKYLYRAVETETFGAGFLPKANVANVILNRTEDERWGDTIKEVVTSPNQFCYGRQNISQETIQACAYAFEIEDTTEGALFFHSGGKTNTFNGASYMFTDEAGHHFYQ